VSAGSIGVRVTFMPGLSRSISRILERVWRLGFCALRVPTPVISSSRSTRPRAGVPSLGQPGAWPPPISPQLVHAGATPGMDASCSSIRASRRAISSLIVSISRRCSVWR
jgi:hypothetical protein